MMHVLSQASIINRTYTFLAMWHNSTATSQLELLIPTTTTCLSLNFFASENSWECICIPRNDSIPSNAGMFGVEWCPLQTRTPSNSLIDVSPIDKGNEVCWNRYWSEWLEWESILCMYWTRFADGKYISAFEFDKKNNDSCLMSTDKYLKYRYFLIKKFTINRMPFEQINNVFNVGHSNKQKPWRN